MYFIRRASGPDQVAGVISPHSQRGIPEDVPLVALFVLRRVLMQPDEDVLFGLRHSAAAGCNLKLRFEALAERHPRAGSFAGCELRHDGLTVVQRECGPKLLAALAGPCESDSAGNCFSLETIRGLVAAHLALHGLSSGAARYQPKRQSRRNYRLFHRKPSPRSQA